MTPFSLYSGAGNTFYLIDNRNNSIFIPSLVAFCKERYIDGVISLEKGVSASYKMRIFNPDGSEAEMCGNGMRCFAKFAKELGIADREIAVETLAGIHHCSFEKEDVSVRMASAHSFHWNLKENLHFLNTGVPHAVLFCKDIESIDVAEEGRKLRFDPLFGEKGANINFVSLMDEQNYLLRTYERGVERETLACTTGAVASAIACVHSFSLSLPLYAHFRSGEKLKINFTKEYKDIVATGPAKLIEKGFFPQKSPLAIL